MINKRYIYISVGILSVIFLINYLAKKRREEILQNLIFNDNDALNALKINQALNPSGFSFLKSFDGTDEDLLFKIAEEIKNIDKVAKIYYEIFNSRLYDDLQKELSAEELQRFFDIIKKKN